MRVGKFLAGLLVLMGLIAYSGHVQSAPPAAKAGDLKRIIVLTNGNSPFWDACAAGVLDANQQLKLKSLGFKASLEVNDGTAQGQIDKLRQYASQADIAAIGISPIVADNAAIADELRAMQKRGIPIVCIDNDLNRDRFADARFAYLGTNNIDGGKALGACAAGVQPDGGEYVTFVGYTGAQNAIERISGFALGAGSKFKSVDSMSDELDRTRARDNVRNALRNHPKVRTLVGIWSYNAPAIVDVLKEMKLREKTKVVIFDAEPIAIQQMAEGDIDGMVVQDPYQMGFQGVKLLLAMVQKDDATIKAMFPNLGKPGGDIFETGLKVVVPDEKSPIRPEHFAKGVQYMTLKQFKDWLAQYGLTGS